MNLEETLKYGKVSRIPDFMGGDINVLLRNVFLTRSINDADYERIFEKVYDLGKDKGIFEGTETGYYSAWGDAKKYFYPKGFEEGYITHGLAGGDKVLITKDKPGVYPFNDMNVLYESESSKPYIKNILKEYVNEEVLPGYQKIDDFNLSTYINLKIATQEDTIRAKEKQKGKQKFAESLKNYNDELDQENEKLKKYKEMTRADITDDDLKNHYNSLKQQIDGLAEDLKLKKAKNGGDNKISTISKYNQLEIDKHLEDINSKNDKNILPKRMMLSQYISEYSTVQNLINSRNTLAKTKTIIEEDTYFENKPSEMRSYFSKIKDRGTAIVIDDNSTILDFVQLRKTVGLSGKPLENIQNRTEQVAIFDSLNKLENIIDYRTDKSKTSIFEFSNMKPTTRKANMEILEKEIDSKMNGKQLRALMGK